MTDETFDEFKRSFFYGSRTDLAFKFLKSLSDEEAAEFLRQLLERLGETIDDGDAVRLIDLAVEWQIHGYTPAPGTSRTWVYDDAPFAAMPAPASKTQVALLTSSGHFVAGDDPAPFGVGDMTQEEAIRRIDDFLRSAPQLSVIPSATPDRALRVRHGGYDIRGVAADPAVAFPLRHLRLLESTGVIGRLHPEAYSFVGAASQKRVLREAAPRWAERLQGAGVEAVLLVPV